MVASPYGFLRGTAVVMAEDVAQLPSTGITPVVCGDAHLGNFGFYASPERDLVIDLNDFDEAHPGGWEWDLRRLVASIWVAGRQNGASEDDCRGRGAVLRRRLPPGVASARRRAAVLPLLHPARRRPARRADGGTAGRTRCSVRPSGRATAPATARCPGSPEEVDGVRRIVEEPPLITRLPDAEAEALAEALDDYLQTLPTHWRRVLGGYTLVDVAHKVVGVGSVGLRAYVALLEGSSPEDVVFLQLKQARRSVLARYVHGESAWHAHQGQRVVEYQQALQTVSDPLLGWTTMDGLQYYVRQFRNMKGTIPLDAIDAEGARRLRRRGRSAAGQGARPHQWRVDDRRLPGSLGAGRRRVVACSPAGTPTRPRPTMRSWWRPSTAAGCPSNAESDALQIHRHRRHVPDVVAVLARWPGPTRTCRCARC